MWWLKVVWAFFGFGKATAEAVTARTKPEEVQVSEHEIEKERLTVKQRRILLRQAEMYLRGITHLKMSVDAYAEVTFDSLSEEDKQDLKQALYELFPKRKHKKVTN